MTSLRKQLHEANKRIEYLETQLDALESIALGRISPAMFGRILKALGSLISTAELVDILIKKEESLENE